MEQELNKLSTETKKEISKFISFLLPICEITEGGLIYEKQIKVYGWDLSYFESLIDKTNQILGGEKIFRLKNKSFIGQEKVVYFLPDMTPMPPLPDKGPCILISVDEENLSTLIELSVKLKGGDEELDNQIHSKGETAVGNDFYTFYIDKKSGVLSRVLAYDEESIKFDPKGVPFKIIEALRKGPSDIKTLCEMTDNEDENYIRACIGNLRKKISTKFQDVGMGGFIPQIQGGGEYYLAKDIHVLSKTTNIK